jgi:hypothetical protein
MPELKRRVWQSLQQSHVLAGSHPFHTRLAGMRVLALAGTIMLLAGTAGAVISGRWIVPALERAESASAPAAAPAARAEKPRAARQDVHAAPDDIIAEDAMPAAPAPVAVPVRRRVERAPVRAASPAVRAVAPASGERTIVFDALVALRRDHDARRAGALLENYLATHAQGPLREEAIVLSIEAADARGDRSLAQSLAHRYQAEFPAGRFRQFARNHTDAK